MLQLSFALALTLLYGDIISPESAALPLHWQAGTSGTVKFAHGITRSYEAVQDGSHVFGNEVSPGGEPELSTRRLLGTGRLIGLGAIGDDFFVVSASEDSKSLNVVRVRDSKALRVPISTFETFVDVTSNGTRLLLTYIQLGAGRGMLLDRDLNLVVP